MSMGIEEIIGDYKAFFSDLQRRLVALPVDIEGMPVSHVCYRVTSLPEYEALRDRVKYFCTEFAENEFNGRPIVMLLLKVPLILAEGYPVSLIELPAPKSRHKYPTGLEHCGFVVGEKFGEFKERYQHVITRHTNRGPYCQPVLITFENGKTAKFYERSLMEVLRLEGKMFVPLASEGK